MTDGLKEELGWLKVLLVLVATSDASLVSWLMNDPVARSALVRGVTGLIITIGIGWGIQMFRRGWDIISDLKGSV